VRRCLHSFLVGILALSFSIDSAKACWYLRHAHRGHAHHGGWHPVPAVPACGPGLHGVVVSDVAVAGGHAWPGDCVVESVVVVQDSCGYEEIACGQPVECCTGGGTVVEHGAVAVESAVVDAAPRVEHGSPETAPVVPPAAAAPAPTESVIAPAAKPIEPVLIPAQADKPVAIAPAAPAEPKLPELQPVAPASATEPAEPTAEEPPATAPAPAAAPETGKMEEPAVAAPPAVAEPAAPEPKVPEQPAPPPAAEPAVQEPAPAEGDEEENIFEQAELEAAASAADEEMPENPPATTAEPPVTEPAEPEDAAGADPLSRSEPMRRWIDATGMYATVGALVAVTPRGVEIRKANGSTVTVPLDRLSDHDRDYAAQTGASMVAGRPAAPTLPQPTDTAGM
jgi:hypothetical protein